MDDLIQKFKTIRIASKITITVKSVSGTADLSGTLVEHPKQLENGRWAVQVKLKYQKRSNTFELGTNVVDVRWGWEGRVSRDRTAPDANLYQ